MDKRNLNAAEYSVAKAVRESIVEHIHMWRSRREGTVFWYLDATWPELKTPLRTWSIENVFISSRKTWTLTKLRSAMPLRISSFVTSLESRIHGREST